MAEREFVIKSEWEKSWIDGVSLEDASKMKAAQLTQITSTIDEHGNILKVKNVQVINHSLKEVGDKLHFDATIKCEVIEDN